MVDGGFSLAKELSARNQRRRRRRREGSTCTVALTRCRVATGRGSLEKRGGAVSARGISKLRPTQLWKAGRGFPSSNTPLPTGPLFLASPLCLIDTLDQSQREIDVDDTKANQFMARYSTRSPSYEKSLGVKSPACHNLHVRSRGFVQFCGCPVTLCEFSQTAGAGP